MRGIQKERGKKMKKTLIGTLIILAICAVLWAAGDETVSITRWVERRNQEPLIKPVWEYVLTAVYDDDDDTDVTQSIAINGILQKVILVAPDGTNAVTYQVEVKDNGDVVIFDSGEQAENATYTWNCSEPLTGTIDVVIGVSGAIGAVNPDITVTLRGI